MKNVFRYILIVLAIGLVGYNSVYFKSLSKVRKTAAGKFDAVGYSGKLWKEKIPARLDSAIALIDLIRAVETNPENAFASYSNALDIGNYRYSLVKVNATVSVIGEDEIVLQIVHADSLLIARLATEYIYGNAIRDASGLVNI